MSGMRVAEVTRLWTNHSNLPNSGEFGYTKNKT
jgi:hypothetical protein